jgi:hypothetical protein
MTEGILGLNIWMGEAGLDDFLFLRKLKSICANTQVKLLTEETLKELLEHVKAILVTHPNEYITIKELANNAAIKKILEHNGNLHIDPDCVLMWYLCRPISFLSPHTLCLECRDHEVYGQWALLYNPAKAKRYQDQEEDSAMDSDLNALIRTNNRILQTIRLRNQQLFEMVIKQEVTLFQTIKRVQSLEEVQDKLYLLLYENNMLGEHHLLGINK